MLSLPRRCLQCYMRGHYRFTRNQISPRKQLTGEIGVYTRVPIQSISLCVHVGCADFLAEDRSVGETEADFSPVKNVTRSLITILESYLTCKARVFQRNVPQVCTCIIERTLFNLIWSLTIQI